MKTQSKILLFLAIAVVCFLNAKSSLAATFISNKRDVPAVWTKAGSPYVIHGQIYAANPVTIEPGVVVKLKNSYTYLSFAKLTAVGTEEEKIYFTSIKDDDHGGDTNNDGAATLPQRGDWYAIILPPGGDFSKIENVSFLYGSSSPGTGAITIGTSNASISHSEMRDSLYSGMFFYANAKPLIEYNIIAGNGVGIVADSYARGQVLKLENNFIANNGTAVKIWGFVWWWKAITVDARNNWWGDATGPYYKPGIYYGNVFPTPANLNGKGNGVVDGVQFDPWLNKDPLVEDPGCQENCFSNVLFLPGIKASRLYNGNDKLWPPNYFGNDLADLALDEDGKSVKAVYTKDVIDEMGIPLVGGNIYKTFLGKLADLKTDQIINNYETFAYDWRQNVEDIAKNGTPYPENVIKSTVTDLIALAESSKSEKVTIITHSNGGLLVKAIMQELESRGLTDKVDKIVLVGTPQMGTPLAMLSLLYGYDEAALFGTLISRSDSRDLAENMPGAYGLLPSKKYFERLENPFISFSSANTRYKIFSDAYGEKINDVAEFRNFLLGKIDGREKPASDEVEKENVLNENILDQALQTHERLDNWMPPEGVEVIQIAGWGLDTVSGVQYSEKEKTDCYFADSKIPSCIGIGEYEPVYEPEFTVDGDKVVVAPSALMLQDAPNVKKYWVDLYRSNKFFTDGKEHKDILEFSKVEEFIYKVLTNTNLQSSLPNYFYNSRPADYDNASPRLRMSLYSPLDIHLYDAAGHHTGPKKITLDGVERTVLEEGIPNSYYYQFGDRKYVGFSGGENIRVALDGYATGTYTLKLEEVAENGEEIAHATFANLPTTADTTVSLDIPATGLADMTPLEADIDSDGASDYEIDKVLNGTAVPPVTIGTISADVDHLVKLNLITDAKAQDFLQVKIRELAHDKDMIEKMESKDNKNSRANQIKLLNKKIDDLIGFIRDKFADTIPPLAQNILIQNLNSVKM